MHDLSFFTSTLYSLVLVDNYTNNIFNNDKSLQLVIQKRKELIIEFPIHYEGRTNKSGWVNLDSKKGAIEKKRDICGGFCGFNSN